MRTHTKETQDSEINPEEVPSWLQALKPSGLRITVERLLRNADIELLINPHLKIPNSQS